MFEPVIQLEVYKNNSYNSSLGSMKGHFVSNSFKGKVVAEAENKPFPSINIPPVREGWRLEVEPEWNLWLDNQGQLP